MMNNQANILFTSNYTIGKHEHKDYSSIAYRSVKREFPFITVLSVLIGLVLPILSGEIGGTALLASAFLFLGVGLNSLMPGLAIRKNYQRMVLTYGKENIAYTTQLGEKIIMRSEIDSTREFDYSEIKHIKQTRHFYMLHVGQNLHIIVGKDVASSVHGLEFIPFLMERCTNLKKKKIIDYTHAKSISLGYLIVHAIIVVLDLLMLML